MAVLLCLVSSKPMLKQATMLVSDNGINPQAQTLRSLCTLLKVQSVKVKGIQLLLR